MDHPDARGHRSDDRRLPAAEHAGGGPPPGRLPDRDRLTHPCLQAKFAGIFVLQFGNELASIQVDR